MVLFWILLAVFVLFGLFIIATVLAAYDNQTSSNPYTKEDDNERM